MKKFVVLLIAVTGLFKSNDAFGSQASGQLARRADQEASLFLLRGERGKVVVEKKTNQYTLKTREGIVFNIVYWPTWVPRQLLARSKDDFHIMVTKFYPHSKRVEWFFEGSPHDGPETSSRYVLAKQYLYEAQLLRKKLSVK